MLYLHHSEMFLSWNIDAVSLGFLTCNKIPGEINLEGTRFILAHRSGGFHPSLLATVAPGHVGRQDIMIGSTWKEPFTSVGSGSK